LYDSPNYGYDFLGYDDINSNEATTPEYITINRASTDKNPWSRYNRWVSKEVIVISSTLNNNDIVIPTANRAVRPIIEFNPNIKLYNFGAVSAEPVDLIDNQIIDAFNAISNIEGSFVSNDDPTLSSIVIDGVTVSFFNRVIFAADVDPLVRNKIFNVVFINSKVALIPAGDVTAGTSVLVTKGNQHGGTSWWFNGDQWIYGQQHTTLNEGPLFDLFDKNGNSYSDQTNYLTNFSGNKIFGYSIGDDNAPMDTVLGLRLNYLNNNAKSSILFENYFSNGIINFVNNIGLASTISTGQTYFKIGDQLINVWQPLVETTIEKYANTDYYDIPLSLANNPMNKNLDLLVHGDLQNQKTKQGTQLISNHNPISFAMMFIGKKEHSVIDAITKYSEEYNYFKLSLINSIAQIPENLDTSTALDSILETINASKLGNKSFYLSDMLGHGQNNTVLKYTISNTGISSYALPIEFNLETPSDKSILIYINNIQLTSVIDYVFDSIDPFVNILKPLAVGDQLVIIYYPDTKKSYIPPTPTKLALYPSFIPFKFLDDTYVTPTLVIQGHDGSITTAFGDYRDDILLEYELRIFNNLKVKYRKELFDIHSVDSGYYRDLLKTNKYSSLEITSILEKDFIKWAINYGIDYTTNNSYDQNNAFTWNYTGLGSWRSIFKYYYDTDRPHTNPWEMLGITQKPSWWDSQYGTAPYTSDNIILWSDLAAGKIAVTPDGEIINNFYARPNLLEIIPVDGSGNLLSPDKIGLVQSPGDFGSRSWAIGDQGPAETAWRRSSNWPFALQKLLALTQPSTYASLMYDPANMVMNQNGQWVYSNNNNQSFLNISTMPIHGDLDIPLNSGFGVFVSEIGQQRDSDYISKLQNDLKYVNFNLFYKVGGFLNKNTVQFFIDAYEPTTNSSGALLPNIDYSLILNSGNPIKSVGISGIIIQRMGNDSYVVRGYDRDDPYFNYYPSVRNAATPSTTIGGIASEYVNWVSGYSSGSSISTLNTSPVSLAQTNTFYQKDQIVQYGSAYYRVLTSHQSGNIFDQSMFAKLSSLPVTGGATVQLASGFSTNAVKVPYGTTFNSIQDVYDLITGYGEWLISQGFTFNQFNNDLGQVVDWNLSATEFLYWTTQNWINNSILTVSPFADQLTYQLDNSVVDNIFNSFYDYTLTKSDGTPFDKKSVFITRQNGVFTIATINTADGIYFARLNSIQKEHGVIFKNTTIFGDIVYDIQTGERQQRIKLVGFRTADWNGEFFAPGFVYDSASITDWVPNTKYIASSIVRYNNFYYSAITNVDRSKVFDFTKWKQLTNKPVAKLLPNFDYKINQFNDFYSLDIDNFDSGQQTSAQQLVGYSPRVYLNNIITNKISQYKFYQGYIRDKGTTNAIAKLSKANSQNLKNNIQIYENWALRVGQYGSFTSIQEFEFPLIEGSFIENPQIITFEQPILETNYSPIYYVGPDKFTISPTVGAVPKINTTILSNVFKFIHAGYVRLDDVDATAYNQISLLDIANSQNLLEGTTIWLGFKPNGEWDVLRYKLLGSDIIDAVSDTIYNNVTITTADTHNLTAGQIISIVGIATLLDGVYTIESIVSPTQFIIVNSISLASAANFTFPGFLFAFESLRFSNFDSIPSDDILYRYNLGTRLWIDSGNGTENNGWAVYKKVNNFSSNIIPGKHSLLDGHGFSISLRKGTDILVVGSPLYKNTNDGTSGSVVVYKNSTLEEIAFYAMPNTSGNNNKLGSVVFYDDIPYPDKNSPFGLIFAGAPGATNDKGMVQIISVDLTFQPTVVNTITTDLPSGKFGSSIFVQRNTSTKKILVGAPAINKVYSYIATATNNSLVISQAVEVQSSVPLDADAQWGYSIAGSDNGGALAISAPFNGLKNSGTVTVILGTGAIQTLYSPFGDIGNFGQAMTMSGDGSYLAISAPNAVNENSSLGAVAIYNNTYNGGIYTLTQTITNLIPGGKMYFGMALDINTMSNALVITAMGTNTTVLTTFDSLTTFDFKATRFTESENYSGTAYLYNRKNTNFKFSQEINEITESVSSLTNFGTSVVIDNNTVLVGAPFIDNQSTGSVYKFSKINDSIDGWETIRIQTDLLLSNSVKQIRLIDTTSDEVVNYFDFVDPLKGKILGIAEKELTYITSADPAIYSIGNEGVNVNPNSSWIDQQVGKLWWDISTAKFIWYEQGELEYRKNNWGKLFPGASIDVYEWVGSTLLPNEWSAIADTPAGMARGISGQPKYVDNSAISVKQIYDNIVGSLSNIYYYWVKNKVTIPDVKNRKISAFSVANYIANPTSSGIQHAAFISTSSLIIANSSAKLRSNEISLNFTIDNSNNKTIKHVEWQLANEGIGKIPSIIEKKIFDSLIGNDSLGNLVPDPRLSERAKYGIDIRPQQTLFKNRLTALRNVLDFANGVLIKNQITGNRSFQHLLDQELPPQPTTSTWVVVEDTSALSEINNLQITTATVISDYNGNGGWAVYQNNNGIWDKIKTQSYNTTLYWKYVDWASDDFKTYKKISYIIDTVYQLSQLSVLDNQYVKIKNRGDGNYIIVTPIAFGTVGTFNSKYDVIYVQNGTIQLTDNLWNLSYGWDNAQVYNQSLFDQTPNIEISNILYSLKNELFINELSTNWNLLVFKAIKYALSEQKFVDWAFKTSLIDVVNHAGTLNQPPVYKLQDVAYYENFVNEIKPYHSKVRRFTTGFENFESSDTTAVDFDYPITYNSTSQQYVFTPIPLSNFTFPESYDPVTSAVNTASYTSSLKLVTVPWRETSSRILFDRISTRDQLGNLTVIDNFLADPGKTLFQLSWLAQADKSKIQVQINDVPIFDSAYTVEYTTEPYLSYNKKYSYLKLLKLENTQTFNLTVIYQKSTELMSAVERIKNFYVSSNDIPGNDLGQLMVGVDSPRKVIGGQYEGTAFANVNYGQILDTLINPSTSDYPSWTGGQIATNTLNNIIDGEFGFISTQPGQAPEELVPGLWADSLAIDVYTKSVYQTPTIFNSNRRVYKSTSTQKFSLSVMPPTVASIIVTINNNLLTYVTTTTFTTSTQFNINWTSRQLVIPPQPVAGTLGYSIIGVGDADYSGLGILDTQTFPVVVSATTGSTKVIGMVNLYEVNGSYVTVDGVPIDTTVYPNVPGQPMFYSLTTASSRDSRAAVSVYNLTTGSHLIQSWFFNSSNPKFNRLNEQIYSKVGTTSTLGTYNQSGYANSINLTSAPANLGPFSSQVIVELIPNQGNPLRLRPPYVTYYTVTTTNIALASYPIVSSTSSFVANTVQASNLQVYLNGLPLSYTLDYTISNNSVILTSRPASLGNSPVVGSKVAIETFYYNNISNAASVTNGSVTYDYDFMVTTDGGSLLLTPNYSYLTSATLKITTFSIQDSLGMVSQRFVGNPLRTYKLSYPVLNSNYLWVEVDTTASGLISLVNNIDYQMLDDHLTVLISEAIVLTNNDTVFIMSFADPSKSSKTLGYRISKDFLGKSSFTRLSNDDSTYLTFPLKSSDEYIYVADGSILSQPNSDKNMPGVVLIAGERIEFFKNINNVLSQLRRGTGGTSPAALLAVGTIVLDQGANQIINILPATPYSDTLLIQNTYTSAALENTFTIPTTSIYNWVNSKTSSTIRCDGIRLMTTQAALPYDPYTGTEVYQNRIYPISAASIDAKDQLEIYYGGRLLKKDQSFYHDTTVSYDGILQTQIKGIVPTALSLSTATIYLGDAYICQDTNEVWVCRNNQYNILAVPSFVYSGLKLSPPDFLINTSTQQLILNTSTIKISTGTQLTVVKRQVGDSWNDVTAINANISLLDSTGTVANFLKSGLAVLPTSYFYGSDSTAVKSRGGLI
jgi:hypothetical protein